VKWFANTNITFGTSSSGSGAVSEAAFTQAVAATTLSGGTVASTLKDAFDGYNELMVNGADWPPKTGDAKDILYNKNGPAAMDDQCKDQLDKSRQVVYPIATYHLTDALGNPGDLTVQRKFYVPADDGFARWANIYTNTGTDPITIDTGIATNLGSDSNTKIVTSSNGDATADLTDQWVTTFQNYSGTTYSDPRLGHVLQGVSPQVGLFKNNFANGDDNPYWGYHLTIQPGKTAVILNFATVQPSKAAAASKSAWLATLPSSTLNCLSPEEQAAVVNFNLSTDASISASAQTSSVQIGGTITYKVTVTNNGPATAGGIRVNGSLPAGSSYQDGSGTGWTIVENGSAITATLDTLAPGTSSSFDINIKAPLTPGKIAFTANLNIDNSDPNPANNTTTVQTDVAQDADLGLNFTGPNAPVHVSTLQTYTLHVTNAGPVNASNVKVTVTLPAGANYVSGSGDGWTLSESVGVVTATRPALDVGDAPAISIQVKAPSVAGAAQVKGEVTADNNDPLLSNNVATIDTTLKPWNYIFVLVCKDSTW
jgi:uncharacterized repeat protein (TIGR01451 family)